MTDAERMAYGYVIGATSTGTDRARVAIALRSARTQGPETHREVLAMALRARAEWRVWLTVTQRNWMAKVSRRPQRGNHHDSWRIREKYARCAL